MSDAEASPHQLAADSARWCGLLLRSPRSIEVENLFLRRQLALYMERGVKPRRMDSATRIALALLSRLFDWRDSLVVVRPETLIRWYRAGWKLFWRLKSRPGCCVDFSSSPARRQGRARQVDSRWVTPLVFLGNCGRSLSFCGRQACNVCNCRAPQMRP